MRPRCRGLCPALCPRLPAPPLAPEKKKADIVFLLDGSINFRRDSFQEVLRFVSGIVDTLYEAGDSIQVGLVQYNSDPTDEFFLREYASKQEVLDAISKVVYKGGRHANTRVGVQHLQQHHFVPEAGSRLDQRVPQIAFVVAGGKSVEDAQQASLALTQRGVKVFAVGVRDIDSQEVGTIASNSATAFRVGTVQELSELSEQVLETLYDAMHETLCPGTPDVARGELRPSCGDRERTQACPVLGVLPGACARDSPSDRAPPCPLSAPPGWLPGGTEAP